MRKIESLILGLAMLLGGQILFGQNPLFIPDTLHGPVYNLTMGPDSMQFLPGTKTATYGINGGYLGPVLIMHEGDNVQMNVTNLLADTSTMHWHGMHVAPEDDGGPHTMILPGATWSPDFTVMDEATTFWYHPHLHEKTAEQVYKGAAGMIFLYDDHTDTLGLPQTYGVDDFPIIIQDKVFDANNQLIFSALADTIMVNGTLDPFLEVPAQMIRFRILNASNQRVYNLGFPPRPTFMIGSDGGLLEQPLPIQVLILGPGERAEVVIDFTNQNGVNFTAGCNNSQLPQGASGGPGGPGGGPGNPLDSADFQLMQFRVHQQTANPVTSLPQNLNSFNKPNPLNVDRVRTKVMTVDSTGFPYHINNLPFNMAQVNDTVLLDDIEIWELLNPTSVAHPFHIHDIQFYIHEFNGGPPPPTLRGRKDVILLFPGDTISFITQFTDFTDSIIPYMYHCHNLFHEDAGMMGQFLVYEAGWVSRENEIASVQGFKLYPNPAKDRVKVRVENAALGKIKGLILLDLSGKVLLKKEFQKEVSAELDLQGLQSGMYLLKIELENGKRGTLRILKK